jgi:hypothetical protein
MQVTVTFPFSPGEHVIAKSERGPFKAKVFSVVRRYDSPDFAVVVDGTGRTHHKFFRELETAGD